MGGVVEGGGVGPDPEPAGLHAPGLLLLGAAGRGAGKTEFAAAILRRVAAEREVVAAKVTTIHGLGQGCPRGGQGCGVCSELGAPFVVTEEQCGPPGKDTVRLLAGGARRVFWLRARRDALGAGASALLDRIGPKALCVCESNSLRHAVEPGLFLFLRSEASPAVKPSAAAVARHADAEVLSDGLRFSPSPEEFAVAGDRWAWRRPATAVVLAGGRSRRMGRDKALLPVGGRPMIEGIVAQLEPFFAEVLVSAAEPGQYSFLGLKTVPDRAPGQGPLMGIASALAAAAHEVALVVPCDVPAVPIQLVLRLLRGVREADGAVPVTAEGLPEPLLAVYRRSALPAIEAALARGEKRIVAFYPGLDIRFLPLPPGLEIPNLNTRDDYERRLRRP